MSKFMNIRPEGAELLLVEGRTDRQTDRQTDRHMMKLIVVFRNFANKRKKIGTSIPRCCMLMC
jgi:hypothetical protein